MSEFVEFLADADEPVTLDEVKQNARVDDDLTADDDFIGRVIIPAARQQAEARTGACLKRSRFIQRLPGFPKKGGSIALDHALAREVEAITYLPRDGAARTTLDPAQYEVLIGVRESLIGPLASQAVQWPDTGASLRAVEITYTAGLNLDDMPARFPGVRAWLLLACTWAYGPGRSLFLEGKDGFNALPDGYYAALLAPIQSPPRM